MENPEMQCMLRDMRSLQRDLDKVTIEPSNRALANIFAYSRETREIAQV
jgi:hypothetical protein